jgi:hypothetical protein
LSIPDCRFVPDFQIWLDKRPPTSGKVPQHLQHRCSEGAMKFARLSLVLVAVMLITSSALYRNPRFVRGQTQNGGRKVACCGQPDSTAPREIDFPFFSLRDGFNSSLLLVSDSPKPMDLTVAVRGLMGETVLAPMSIEPQEKLAVDVRSLLEEQKADVNGAFAEGSIAVYFIGTIMPLAGQLTMTNPTLSLVHESEMVQNDPGHSDIPPVLNGLWWGLGGGAMRGLWCRTLPGSR